MDVKRKVPEIDDCEEFGEVSLGYNSSDFEDRKVRLKLELAKEKNQHEKPS